MARTSTTAMSFWPFTVVSRPTTKVWIGHDSARHLVGKGGPDEQNWDHGKGAETQAENGGQTVPADLALAEVGPERQDDEDGADDGEAGPAQQVLVTPGPFAVGGQECEHHSVSNG